MELNKQHKYRGVSFTVTIQFDTVVEKMLDGKRWNTVTVFNLGQTGYNLKKEGVEKKILLDTVDKMVAETEAWIDWQLDNGGLTEEQKKLLDDGFTFGGGK